MYCESSDAVKAAVKAGMGVGVVYRDLAQNEIDRGEVKVLQVRGLVMHSNSYIIYPRDKTLSADAQEFLDLLRRQIASTKQPVKDRSPLQEPLYSSASSKSHPSVIRVPTENR
jgi:DNA-binding transcriptional LysR family regulator